MSQVVPPVANTYDADITTFSDADDLNSTNFVTHFQRISNRFKFLYDRLLSSTAIGTEKWRQVADVAALKAINPGGAGYVDGDVVSIIGTNHFGSYRYNASASTTEALPWVIAPAAGSGRWFKTDYDLRPRCQVAGHDSTNITISSATSSSPTVVSTVTLPSVQAGAYVVVRGHFGTNPSGGNGVVNIRISENGGTATSVLGCTEAITPGTAYRGWAGARQITTAGNVVVTLDAYRNGATTMSVLAPYSLVAEVTT
jgi:hypothetical protein